MPADLIEADFAEIFRRDVPLLDVRSPVEFARGAFPASRNIPLLSDEQRSEIGTLYREQGGAAALALGHRLVGGEARERLIGRWRAYVRANPQARLYCFRGGQRSHIAQGWLAERGVAIPLVAGGYKALRNFLLAVLEQASRKRLLVIAGKTGCGKTHLINALPGAIDIEGAARHRGSAFGALPGPQPGQIDFENRLAVAALKLGFESLPALILEDEGRSVGSLAIPHGLFNAMRQAPIALVEEALESRVETILRDYILANLAAWESHCPGEGGARLEQSLLAGLGKIRRRLGGGNHEAAGKLMRRAFAAAGAERIEWHREWIALLVENYYDPMYEYQLARKRPRIEFRGTRGEVAQWCRDYLSSYCSSSCPPSSSSRAMA